MWYFLIKQSVLETKQYQTIQKRASLTEIERFNEPYEDWYVFTIDKEAFTDFTNYLDLEGIAYELTSDRPTRAELLAGMN